MRICSRCKHHTLIPALEICPECGGLMDEYPSEGMKRLMDGER